MKEIFKKLWITNKIITSVVFVLICLGVVFVIYLSIIGIKLLLSIAPQIDPLNFIGTIIIGLLTLVLFKKQNEISELALESKAPNLIIKETFYDKNSKNSTPYIEISNSETLSISNLHIFYMVSADDKNKRLGVFENKYFQGIEIYKNQTFRIDLEGSTANLYHSIIFLYQNPISKKVYTYGVNINFLENNNFMPIGVDYLKEDFVNVKSPLSLSSFKVFLEKTLNDKNLSNYKDILTREYLN